MDTDCLLVDWLIDWLIVYNCFTSFSRIFHSCRDVTFAGEGLCSEPKFFKYGGIFIVSYPLWHGTSVYWVSNIQRIATFTRLIGQARETDDLYILTLMRPDCKVICISEESQTLWSFHFSSMSLIYIRIFNVVKRVHPFPILGQTLFNWNSWGCKVVCPAITFSNTCIIYPFY